MVTSSLGLDHDRLVRTMRFTDLGELEAGRDDLEAVICAWCDWKAAVPRQP
jgi:hypothetical protein